jgi:Cu/Zn superoxide dismutase
MQVTEIRRPVLYPENLNQAKHISSVHNPEHRTECANTEEQKDLSKSKTKIWGSFSTMETPDQSQFTLRVSLLSLSHTQGLHVAAFGELGYLCSTNFMHFGKCAQTLASYFRTGRKEKHITNSNMDIDF